MVRKKNEESGAASFRSMFEDYDRANPIVDTKWAVEEVTPGYNTGGYYDQDIPEESHVVSPKFDKREDAETWMDDHEADKGKHLALVEFVYREIKHISVTKIRVKK